MRKHGRVRVAVLVLAALALLFGGRGVARAGVIYQTGFEPPTYSLGTLNGKDGWSTSSNADVQNSTVLSGTQAAGFNATTVSGQDLAAHAISYSSLNNPDSLVRIQEAFFLSAAGTPSNWDVIAAFGNNNVFLGQVLVLTNNTATLGLASTGVGSVPVTRGQWNSFELDLNFQTQIQSAFVNGVFIGQGSFANPATSLNVFEFGVNSAHGTDQAFLDNLSITSSSPTVPEPSSLALLSLGGLGLAGWRRWKKRATA